MPGNEEYNEAFDDWREAQGIKGNTKDDLHIFLSALVTNSTLLLVLILTVSVMRKRLPQMYENNVRKKEDGGHETAPFEPCQSFFGWVRAGFSVTSEQARKSCGVDGGMFVEFHDFCMQLLAATGIPLVIVLCPLHYFAGGGRALKGGDMLSTIGLNNVVDGSWLFWVHALVVWYVAIVSEHLIFLHMRRFLDIRFKWLLEKPPPQAVTALVEGIPEAQRSDTALKEYFSKLYPAQVESAFIVKNTRQLKPMVEKLKQIRLELEMMIYKSEHRTGRRRKTMGETAELKEQDEIKALRKEVNVLEQDVRTERDEILAESAGSPRKGSTVNTSSGFVTFTSQREALIALGTRCSADEEEFVLSMPPQPSDIIYEDLQISRMSQRLLEFLGFVCILLLFWSYLPFVVILSSFTNLKALQRALRGFTAFQDFLGAFPWLTTMIDGVLSTMAFVLFMSFLPTILMIIFQYFYSLKAFAWAQLKIQKWYFAFLSVYILLIYAVGNSIVGRAKRIYDHPPAVFEILADALPTATNFYMDYMLVQWVTHGMGITRYIQVVKYLSFRAVLSEERAIEQTEPENQDYYGIGGRSARAALDIVIALVFLSLNPILSLVTFINVLISRIVHAYLLVFSETRKHDLGGPFFVQKMWHVQFGVLLYSILMCSIFYRRASPHVGPVVISSLAVLYVIYSCWRMQRGFRWEVLPFADVCTEEAASGNEEKMHAFREQGSSKPTYCQPELLEEFWDDQANRSSHMAEFRRTLTTEPSV